MDITKLNAALNGLASKATEVADFLGTAGPAIPGDYTEQVAAVESITEELDAALTAAKEKA